MSDEKGLESLKAWRKSVDFAVRIHKEVLPTLPAEEKWALASQLRRAAQSISANVAEGYGRYYFQEGIRFCYLARGSLTETRSHLVLAKELGYLPEDAYTSLLNEIDELQRILNGYIAFLKHSKRGQDEPGSQQTLREDFDIYNIDPEPLDT